MASFKGGFLCGFCWCELKGISGPTKEISLDFTMGRLVWKKKWWPVSFWRPGSWRKLCLVERMLFDLEDHKFWASLYPGQPCGNVLTFPCLICIQASPWSPALPSLLSQLSTLPLLLSAPGCLHRLHLTQASTPVFTAWLRLWPPRGQTPSQIHFLSSSTCVWFNSFLQNCDWVKVHLKWFHRKEKERNKAHLSRHCHKHYRNQGKVWENAIWVLDNLILDVSSFMINIIWL